MAKLINERNRLQYSLLILLVIALGLLSRTNMIGGYLREYAGDTLWALLLFLLLALIFNRAQTLKLAIMALIIAYSIECSQLYHAAWIDAIRNTIWGSLILGYGFLWTDLICYAGGILIAVIVEFLFFRRNSDINYKIDNIHIR